MQPIGNKSFIPRDQEVVCVQCYEEQYAQRCMKCNGVSGINGFYHIKNEDVMKVFDLHAWMMHYVIFPASHSTYYVGYIVTSQFTKALSTLATIVAEFGDRRRKRRHFFCRRRLRFELPIYSAAYVFDIDVDIDIVILL